MDDKYRYGESMEPMVEVPVIQLGESELERTVRGWRREADGKHTGRNDLLFVEKTMRMNERVWPKMKTTTWICHMCLVTTLQLCYR